MANVTVWDSNTRTALTGTSTAVATMTLLPEYEYELTHTGLAIDGSTATTDTIMLAVGSATAAASVGENKLFLANGVPVRIGPGVSTLKYDAVAGVPVFNITANVYRGGNR